MDVAETASRGESALRTSLWERGFAYSRIVGESMRPSLRSGDVVLLKPCGAPRPGDIVTFALGKRLVTHRVVTVDGSTITCRGDNRLGADPPVARGAVIARVVDVVGRTVPDGPLCLFRVRAHWLGVDWRRRCARLRDEATLLGKSLGGHEGGPPVPPTVTGVTATGAATGGHVVQAAETADPRALVEEHPDELLVFPAEVYGGMPSSKRREVMQAVRGHRVAVYGLPRASAGRITTLMARVRGSLQAHGFRGGEPGDMAVRDDAGLRSLHTFTAAELEQEVERFGLGPVKVETVLTDSGPLLRATAGPA